MTQHFLVSPQARGNLCALKIARLSNDEALKILCELRWGNSGTQICPTCGVIRKHYFIKVRNQWRCAEKNCGHTFSVTSGTKFAYHKKPYNDILYAVALFVNGVEGVAAMRMAGEIGVGHKPIFVFNHKLREAIYESCDLTPLVGEVEMDGCYHHYYVRPKNKRTNRVDRRLSSNLNPNKRAIFAMRERGEAGQGARRTIIAVIKQENERDVVALVKKYVDPSSTIFSDEHSCYTALAANYDVRQVNHAAEYSSDDGTNENQAETFFARVRKLFSHIHKCEPKYLLYYGNELVWRDDNRRKSFDWLFFDLLKKCLLTSQSNNWSKYWQGNHLKKDTLFAAVG